MKASSIPKLVSTMVLVVFGCSRIAKGKEEAMELESKKDHDMAGGGSWQKAKRVTRGWAGGHLHSHM
jgi:hypothetical protein